MPADVTVTAIHNIALCVLLSSFRTPVPLPPHPPILGILPIGVSNKESFWEIPWHSGFSLKQGGYQQVWTRGPECANTIQLARPILSAQVPQVGWRGRGPKNLADHRILELGQILKKYISFYT